MSDDLISRSKLKKAVENLVAGGEERLIEYYKNGSKSEENGWIGGIYDAWEEIIDAPPIETTIENLISTLSIEELKATTWFKVDTPSGESISFRREKTGEWIPVSERLPEDMQKVLVWFKYYRYGDYNCMYQTYGFGYVCDGKWSPFINGETGWQDARIIAWMPLPEPYKEAEE